MKTCSECKEAKAVDEFALRAGASDGRQARCRGCFSRYNAARYAADPERFKAHERAKRRAAGAKPQRVGRDPVRYAAWLYAQRVTKHGLTLTQYHRLAAEGCGVCSRHLDPSDRQTHIDHDHTCCPGTWGCARCVRGVLCSPCNKVLGFARDDPATLRAAIAYLERAPSF